MFRFTRALNRLTVAFLIALIAQLIFGRKFVVLHDKKMEMQKVTVRGRSSEPKAAVADAKGTKAASPKRAAKHGSRSPRRNSSPKAEKAIKAAVSKASKGTETEVERIGVLWALMVACAQVLGPLFIFYCWICLHFHDGAIIYPRTLNPAEIASWLQREVLAVIWEHAFPTWRATAIWVGWVLWQAILFQFAPGPVGRGLPLADGTRLTYKVRFPFLLSTFALLNRPQYNGQFAFATTLVVATILHFTGIFRVTEWYENFGPLISVVNIYVHVVILSIYIFAPRIDRPSNSAVYNYFMGPMLNPRPFGFDLKWFHELRPGIMLWLFMDVSIAVTQYEREGRISIAMALICFYSLCYVNACYKGEHLVPMTMDITYEKFGWMLLWLDIGVVPFIFPFQAYALLGKGDIPLWMGITFLIIHCIGYYVFDTANAQKDNFRATEEHIDAGFPNLPWSKLKNPKYINTKRGTKLLVDGFWKYARHLNYTGDLIMSWIWAITSWMPTGSFFPWMHSVYLTPLLIHRERRDHNDCKRKYGADWDRYCEMVPYRFIPYVY